MKVEIWSDVMCPFCYIGKRNFEKALTRFREAGEVKIEWHSFQLDPEMKSGTGKSVYEYLAERKGMTYGQSVAMHAQVVDAAKAAGLDYRFDLAKVANSFDAHRLVQLAKKHGLGDEAEEALFKAYFTEGRDISDHPTLSEIGEAIGLDKEELGDLLATNRMADEVMNDIGEASAIGIRGVPFFVFNRKYAVSGAQPPEVFLGALEKLKADR
ncbi:DsbA family oxidoreductase [Hufsiella ginkgonis]|uniref:Thioredoxin domain-containing protein n=1 Tax=Hufsiella ginkgonis TaxID=2695274 RepID=A0A7K1Y1Z1_9SPHI|nr:DsbA family oxidoreductase [Hufsiella ginkgonis]MXV17098.1 thioredoxin domain-containing protein [Hufsiella ginkgonis]